jgi:hypothetical protein
MLPARTSRIMYRLDPATTAVSAADVAVFPRADVTVGTIVGLPHVPVSESNVCPGGHGTEVGGIPVGAGALIYVITGNLLAL